MSTCGASGAVTLCFKTTAPSCGFWNVMFCNFCSKKFRNTCLSKSYKVWALLAPLGRSRYASKKLCLLVDFEISCLSNKVATCGFSKILQGMSMFGASAAVTLCFRQTPLRRPTDRPPIRQPAGLIHPNTRSPAFGGLLLVISPCWLHQRKAQHTS